MSNKEDATSVDYKKLYEAEKEINRHLMDKILLMREQLANIGFSADVICDRVKKVLKD